MEELDKIINNEELTAEQKAAEINKLIGSNYIPRNKFNDKVAKLEEERNTIKTDFDNYKASKMTEEEKKAEEEAKRAAKTQELSNRLSTMMVENAFARNGLDEESYKDIIPTLVQTTPEATEKVVNSVVEILKKQKDSIEGSYKASMKAQTPKPDGGNSQNQAGQTDKEKLVAAYSATSSPVEQAAILTELNKLNN